MIEAVQHLYRVFGNYPLKQIEACTCCVLPEEIARISKPLAELGREELQRYVAKAMTTWGDEENFKRFLHL